MARFFIDRPIFAWVIAIILMLAGVLAIRSLPVSQFPVIAAPTVTITASYPGADAQTPLKGPRGNILGSAHPVRLLVGSPYGVAFTGRGPVGGKAV